MKFLYYNYGKLLKYTKRLKSYQDNTCFIMKQHFNISYDKEFAFSSINIYILLLSEVKIISKRLLHQSSYRLLENCRNKVSVQCQTEIMLYNTVVFLDKKESTDGNVIIYPNTKRGRGIREMRNMRRV